MTGVAVFDSTVQKTYTWIDDLARELGWQEKQRVFQGLRVTLHTLRDRLTVEEAAHLGAQLPILLSGFYYENWRPGTTPNKERSKEEFLAHIQDYFENIDPSIDAELLVRAVFKVLAQRVSQGEIDQVKNMMKPDMQALWPESVPA